MIDNPDDKVDRINLPQFSVTEISHALKNVIEGAFSYVRVRGELSKITLAKSGHLYSDLKDDQSVLSIICWKGQVSRLSVKPEEGMEVICTGRITTYPGRSNYQMIIESMELAGEGALLKMLEERRKKLAAEGLFDEARKKTLPFLPDVVGVVTSPTGAVIRDIMHRLDDRFPRRVLLWPVLVQGNGAVEQVVAAIRGFNALPKQGEIPRPDVLIVARGGGSLEDLMPFNDEAVVRAVADSGIPVISAIGHETDTTLIDYVADKRAPTPTGAAEMAVPVRAEIMIWVENQSSRLKNSTIKRLEFLKSQIDGLRRGLTDPARLLETVSQRFDFVSEKMDGILIRFVDNARARLDKTAAGIVHPRRTIDEAQRRSDEWIVRLVPAFDRVMADKLQKTENLSALLKSYSYHGVLERGFALVRDKASGVPITRAAVVQSGQNVELVFADGSKQAIIDNK